MTTRLLRGAVEWVTRSWVYKRRLPSEFNHEGIYVTPSAGLKYLFRRMKDNDPSLLRNVRELVRLGDVVWDIGANVGLFTFAAAATAGPTGAVIAFEPDIWLVRLLRRSQNELSPGSAPVTIVAAAVASRVSLRVFNIARRARASSSLNEYGHSQMGGVQESQIVPAFTLDWLLDNLPPPRILKCDVEGAEIEVFKGQHTMLSKVRPVVVCEVCREASAEIARLFLSESYRLYDGEKPLLGAGDVCAARWNTVAIPEELCQEFTSPSENW